MEWIFLVIAGFLEITWAVTLKLPKNLIDFWPSIFTGAAMLGTGFDLSLRSLPIGTAHAVWTGNWRRGNGYYRYVVVGRAAGDRRMVCIF